MALNSGKPVAFGVLTVDTLAQAEERSAENDENKGAEAALSAVEMVNLIRRCVLMAEHNALAAQRRKARHYGLQALYQWTLLVPVPLT